MKKGKKREIASRDLQKGQKRGEKITFSAKTQKRVIRQMGRRREGERGEGKRERRRGKEGKR